MTLEPCVHHGNTPPCIDIIKKKGIKEVNYSIYDPDKRTFQKAKYLLNKSKIKVKIGLLKKNSLYFYKSYFLSKNKSSLPYTDIKIAISKDYYSINKKGKWITNQISRTKGHLLRSKYDCILSTYKSVNKKMVIFATVNHAGHEIPLYKPEVAYNLMKMFVEKKFTSI